MSGLLLAVVERLGPWRHQWDELAAAAERPTPFLRSWWLETMSRHELQVVLLTEGDHLVGGAAFEVTKRFGVEWVHEVGGGEFCADHVDLLARPGRHAEVAEGVGSWLRRPGSRVIDLAGVADGAWLPTALPRPLSSDARWVAPYAAACGFEEYVASRRRNQRKQLRRVDRELAAEHMTVTHTTLPGPHAERALTALVALHRERWGRRSGLARADLLDRVLVAARRALAAGDGLVVTLDGPTGTVAASLVFTLSGHWFRYTSGRSLRSEAKGAGTLLTCVLCRDAMHAGVEVDLLRGAESYKRYWATGTRPLWRHRASLGRSGHAALRALELGEQAASARRRLLARRRRTSGTDANPA